jgi:S1-C subfamily serine protease
MRIAKTLGAFVALTGLVVLGVVYAPSVSGQSSTNRGVMVLDGRGSELGIRIDDTGDGVKVGEVSPNGPAEKAGMKAGDIIVSFDGEKVRSGRQLSRLVRETPSGKAVTARIRRDGSEKDLKVTPAEGSSAGTFTWSGNMDGLQDRLNGLTDRLNNMNFDRMRDFNFDYAFPEMLSGRRLGVSTSELTDQLAKYFGVDDGVLVTAVTDGSAAAKAGLKAGDVITSIDGHRVTSRDDLVRDLRDGTTDDVSIGIVRDKKEATVKANVPAPSRTHRGHL